MDGDRLAVKFVIRGAVWYAEKFAPALIRGALGVTDEDGDRIAAREVEVWQGNGFGGVVIDGEDGERVDDGSALAGGDGGWRGLGGLVGGWRGGGAGGGCGGIAIGFFVASIEEQEEGGRDEDDFHG